MNTIDNLISKTNSNGFKIIKLDYTPESQRIILLKINQNSELFIEILDLKINEIKEILLNEKIHIRPYARVEFHSIDDENFYLNSDSLHFKINSKGETVLKDQLNGKISSLNNKHALKNYIFREDLELIDLKDFKTFNLTDFFDDHFDQYDFTYFYFDDRYSIFSSPDENILIITVYCKDGDDPKCFHGVLKIKSPEDIQVLFVDKIDDLGCYYVISENLRELAYEKYFLDDDNLYIRELSEENFKKSEHFIIDKTAELIFFNDQRFVLLHDKKIEIWERNNKSLLKSISIDQNSSYKIKNGILLYIKDAKLNYTEL